MARKVKINNCAECPHMDNEYYNYERECWLLNKILGGGIYCFNEKRSLKVFDLRGYTL